MKDQYFGDINDYRKYGLLRSIGVATGLRSAICWLRTENDDRTDGELRSYLHQPQRWRHYDPELYDRLALLREHGTTRSTRLAEAWDLLPGATYQHELLVDGRAERRAYLASTWRLFDGIPLLFFDPDNGIEVPSVRWGNKRSAKYVFWHELEEAASRGHSLLVYQHFPREPRSPFIASKVATFAARLGASQVQVYQTSHVAFFLVPTADHTPAFERLPALVRDRWPDQFTVAVHEAT